MKKKIFNILLIAIFSILILETKVNASNIVSTDKQVNSGDGNVTISITSKETLGAYNLELVDNSGLELVVLVLVQVEQQMELKYRSFSNRNNGLRKLYI